MKLSKEELKKKIDEVVQDEDVKISLLEDVEDSFESVDTTEKDTEIASLKAENEELKRKYKERFLSKDEVVEEKTEDVEEVEETEEEPRKFEDLFDEEGEIK